MSTPSSPRLYFAYGIHLHQPSMRSILKGARMVGLARLKNHVISFHGHSAVWDGAIETVVPDKTSEVWGVLYQLTAYEWDQLDTFQDVRLDGTGEYFHYPVEVFTEKNECIETTLYKKAELREPKKPASNTWILLFKAPSPTNFPNTILRNYVKLRRFPPHTRCLVCEKKKFPSRVIAPVARKTNIIFCSCFLKLPAFFFQLYKKRQCIRILFVHIGAFLRSL